jgi:hypothetical protein
VPCSYTTFRSCLWENCTPSLTHSATFMMLLRTVRCHASRAAKKVST